MSSHSFLSPSFTHIGYNCAAAALRSFQVRQLMDLMREVGVEFYGLENSDNWEALTDDSNAPADRGTKLHTVFELCVVAGTAENITEFMTQEGVDEDTIADTVVTDKMVNHINYVLDNFESASETFVEVNLPLKGFPSGGTMDIAWLESPTLFIRDLKTGHIEVSSVENSQLMTYAVGIMDHLGWPEDVKTVNMDVMALHFQTEPWEMSTVDLLKYKREVMLPAFINAYQINPKATPGDHCYYCDGKLYCSEFHDVMGNEMSNEAFDNTDFENLDTSELEHLWILSRHAERFKEAVGTELLMRFEGFEDPVNVKRRDGKKMQYWNTEGGEVAKALAKKVTNKKVLYQIQLKTPKQMIAVLGEETVSEFITKRTGKPYLQL